MKTAVATAGLGICGEIIAGFLIGQAWQGRATRTDNPAPKVAQEGFTGADRVRAAENLMSTLERARSIPQARPLSPEAAAALRRAIDTTPDLPAETRERSRSLLPPPPGP